MPFWIAVHLPRLPLDALHPSWPEAAGTAGIAGTLSHAVPTVVLEQERVVLANRPAMALGVSAGMRRGGVQALSAEVVHLERDPAAEAQLLTAAALALLRFTPQVTMDEELGPATVALDVTASLRLFGGHRALCRAVRACIRSLGTFAQIGCGTTAHGAAWLAAMPLRLGRRGQVLRPARRAVRSERMARLLDRLPVEMLASLADPRWLDGIGCRTVGEVRWLPRAGLQRRLGTELLARLDQAYGESPARLGWFTAPPTFAERMELPGRTESAAGVLAGAQRLLQAVAGWLTAHQAGVTRFVLRLEHERQRRDAAIAATPVTVSLAQPSRDPVHLSRLLQEKLDRLQFEAPVVGLMLKVDTVAECLPQSDTLFPEPGGGQAELGRVLDTLVARLGRENVLQPHPLADHRPECANRWRPVDEAGTGLAASPRASAPGVSPPRVSVSRISTAQVSGVSAPASTPVSVPASADAALPDRPLWLLEPPLRLPVRRHRPCHGSPLTLLSRPERIESGWWDGALATRDYFIAERGDGLRCWIYRERPGREGEEEGEYRWFLHGLFG
ncbi:DNA polymerase Y family protein [Cupriavidus sp. DB3]|uniref:Y-family DNA polymerase n=1 Tax=Cupriavidus sp. DB3 TaxID=2873259 RepID=UPI001CF42199|nr:DNA polymerase Y family protein [Cupriavidus sp. DB3]MCA7082135.1 DNA polymerase Y family protein [Cupriavidus sp. DB3]